MAKSFRRFWLDVTASSCGELGFLPRNCGTHWLSRDAASESSRRFFVSPAPPKVYAKPVPPQKTLGSNRSTRVRWEKWVLFSAPRAVGARWTNFAIRPPLLHRVERLQFVHQQRVELVRVFHHQEVTGVGQDDDTELGSMLLAVQHFLCVTFRIDADERNLD